MSPTHEQIAVTAFEMHSAFERFNGMDTAQGKPTPKVPDPGPDYFWFQAKKLLEGMI